MLRIDLKCDVCGKIRKSQKGFMMHITSYILLLAEFITYEIYGKCQAHPQLQLSWAELTLSHSGQVVKHVSK